MKHITTILLAGTIAFFVSACGGGSSDSSTPGELELVTITEQNADAVIASAIVSIDSAMDIEDTPPFLSTTSSVVKSTSIMTKYAETVSNDLASSGTEACSGGGSVTYNIDDYTFAGIYSFNECVETDTIITGTVIYDGTVETTRDATGILYTVKFTEFKMQIDNIITYYEHAFVDRNGLSGDLSTSITGYITDGVDRVDLKDYVFTLTGTGDNLTANGFVKTNCIPAWIEVKTIQTLVMSSNCPINGEIDILGNNSDIKMVFNSDESADVSLNGLPYNSYNTCDELPSIDEGCP